MPETGGERMPVVEGRIAAHPAAVCGTVAFHMDHADFVVDLWRKDTVARKVDEGAAEPVASAELAADSGKTQRTDGVVVGNDNRSQLPEPTRHTVAHTAADYLESADSGRIDMAALPAVIVVVAVAVVERRTDIVGSFDMGHSPAVEAAEGARVDFAASLDDCIDRAAQYFDLCFGEAFHALVEDWEEGSWEVGWGAIAAAWANPLSPQRSRPFLHRSNTRANLAAQSLFHQYLRHL